MWIEMRKINGVKNVRIYCLRLLYNFVSDLIKTCSKRHRLCYDSLKILLLILIISSRMCTWSSFAYFSSISWSVSAIYCPNELYLLTVLLTALNKSWWFVFSSGCCWCVFWSDCDDDDDSSPFRCDDNIGRFGNEFTQMRGKLSWLASRSDVTFENIEPFPFKFCDVSWANWDDDADAKLAGDVSGSESVLLLLRLVSRKSAALQSSSESSSSNFISCGLISSRSSTDVEPFDFW